MPICWGIRLAALVVSVLLAGPAGCSRAQDRPIGAESLDEIRARGELVVLTLASPTTFQLDDDMRAQGYEVELIEAFAAHLGVGVRYTVFRDLRDLLVATAAGRGHVAAGGVTITQAREEFIRFGPAYRTVREQLVCRRGGVTVRSVGDMAGAELAVVGGSSYEETLRGLRDQVPELRWRPVEAASAMPLIERVHEGELDCTVADSNLIAHARLRYPELRTPLNLSVERSLAFALPREADELAEAMEAYAEEMHGSGLLDELDERWYGITREFDYVDTARFVRRVDERLPALRPHFEAAAEATGVDWRWLAAQAYQESHWDPRAVSSTGVRGVMMLTLPTAREMGVSDRTDPVQSIHGGARYLRSLYDRIPEDTQGEDRLFLAFAAYNIGMGHMYDARRLAERRGGEKTLWPDVRAVFPLLSDPEHYRTLPRGYARGREPVQYVANIRRYHALLELHAPDEDA